MDMKYPTAGQLVRPIVGRAGKQPVCKCVSRPLFQGCEL